MIIYMAYIRDTHPELVSQFADPALAEQLTPGSNKKVAWICPDHPESHHWEAVVASRAKGSGCPYCANRRVLVGFNDMATTHPKLAAELDQPALGLTTTSGSRKPVTWRCLHGHTWDTSPAARRNGTGCPVCAGHTLLVGFNDMATTHPRIAAQLVDPAEGHIYMANTTTKLMWQCSDDPEHTWKASGNSRVNGTGCPHCAGKQVTAGRNDLATLRPELAAQLADPQPDGTPADQCAAQLRPGSNTPVTWVCGKHVVSVSWTSSPNSRRAGTGCPVCSERLVVPGVNDLATTHPELAAEIALDQADKTPSAHLPTTLSRGSHRILTWQCANAPAHRWQAAVKDRVRGTGCPDCACVGRSRAEEALREAVRSLVPHQPLHERALIAGRTGRPGGSPSVDILVPGHHLGIEFNGLYWHSDATGTSSTYHRDKSRLAAEHGLRLVHVWEDEWALSPAIVLRSLAHRLSALDHLHSAFMTAGIPDQFDPRFVERLGARTLTPAATNRAQADNFFRRHHIQGSVTLSRSYALLDDDGEIRALLGLRSPKANSRAHRREGQWEIQRYATLGLVPGGFTRLLEYARTQMLSEGVDLTSWISLSDNGVSEGGMYTAAGFTHDGEIRPSYWYTGGIAAGRRAPKEGFQKKRFREDPALLWDEDWTEREAAAANRLHRVYDAGKTRWVKPVVR